MSETAAARRRRLAREAATLSVTDTTWSVATCALRLREGQLELRAPDGARGEERWIAAPLRHLAQRWPVGEGPWPWLRDRGIRRPSPSGSSGTRMTSAERRASGMVPLMVRVPEATAERLAALIEGGRHGRTQRAVLEAALDALEEIDRAPVD